MEFYLFVGSLIFKKNISHKHTVETMSQIRFCPNLEKKKANKKKTTIVAINISKNTGPTLMMLSHYSFSVHN